MCVIVTVHSVIQSECNTKRAMSVCRVVVSVINEDTQGRNFALKSGGTDSEGERGARESEAKAEENWEEVVFPSHRTLRSGRASLALTAGSGPEEEKAQKVGVL